MARCAVAGEVLLLLGVALTRERPQEVGEVLERDLLEGVVGDGLALPSEEAEVEAQGGHGAGLVLGHVLAADVHRGGGARGFAAGGGGGELGVVDRRWAGPAAQGNILVTN